MRYLKKIFLLLGLILIFLTSFYKISISQLSQQQLPQPLTTDIPPTANITPTANIPSFDPTHLGTSPELPDTTEASAIPTNYSREIESLESYPLLNAIGDYFNIQDQYWNLNTNYTRALLEVFDQIIQEPEYDLVTIEEALKSSIESSPFKSMDIAPERWSNIANLYSPSELRTILEELNLLPPLVLTTDLTQEMSATILRADFSKYRDGKTIGLSFNAIDFSNSTLTVSLNITEDDLNRLSALNIEFPNTEHEFDILSLFQEAQADEDGFRTITLELPQAENLRDIKQVKLFFETPDKSRWNIDFNLRDFDLTTPPEKTTEEETSKADIFLNRIALLKSWDLTDSSDSAYIDQLIEKDPQLLTEMEEAVEIFSAFTWRNPCIEHWNIMDELLLEFLTEDGSITTLANNTALRSKSLFALDYFMSRELDLNNTFDMVLWNALFDDNALLENRGSLSTIDLIAIDDSLKDIYSQRWEAISELLPQEMQEELAPDNDISFSDFLQNTRFDIFVKYMMLIPENELEAELNAIIPDRSEYSDIDEFSYMVRINTSMRISNYLEDNGITRESLPLYIDKETLLENIRGLTSSDDIKEQLGDEGIDFIKNGIIEYIEGLNIESFSAEEVAEISGVASTLIMDWFEEHPPEGGDTTRRLGTIQTLKDELSLSIDSQLAELDLLSIEDIDSVLTLFLVSDNPADMLLKAIENRAIDDQIYGFVGFDKFGRPELTDLDEFLDFATNLAKDNPANAEYIQNTARMILLENYLGRRLDLRHYKDLIAFNRLQQQDLDIDDFAQNLSSREASIIDKDEIINSLIAQESAEGMEDYVSDWYWEEMGSNAPLDQAVDAISLMGTFREILESTIWDFAHINLNESREGPFVRYFSEYYPGNGAGLEDALYAILLTEFLEGYSETTTLSQQDPAGYSGWRLSSPIEMLLMPYTVDQVRGLFLYTPEIKALLEALVGPPEYTYDTDMTAADMVMGDIRSIVQYFLDTQDKSSGIFKDAGGSVDNSIGVSGFGITALIIAHQLEMIGNAEFFDRISLLIDFCNDDKNDPTDLAADNW